MRALLFDVFGTCVDWRSPVRRELRERGLPEELADEWRALYQPQLETVRSGAREWVDLDVLHREALDRLLARRGLEVADAGELTRVWHRLDPWPDVVPGLSAMKRDHVIAPCSNGHIAQSVNLAKHARLPWDAILGAEIARAYKPQPEVYLRSAAALGLEPGEVTMVAAHNGDLAAAQALGLGTAFVPRPTEHGPGQTTDLEPEGDWDDVARDFEELAKRLEPRTRPASAPRRP
jgi:2-haloacid dehalogenase